MHESYYLAKNEEMIPRGVLLHLGELRSFRPKDNPPEVDPPDEQTVHQITKIKLLFHFLVLLVMFEDIC